MLPRLNGDLAGLNNGMSTEAAEGCHGKNGFELYRLLCREIDAVYANADFHMEVAIQRLGEKKCRTLEQTRELVREIRHPGQGVPGEGRATSAGEAPCQILLASHGRAHP